MISEFGQQAVDAIARSITLSKTSQTKRSASAFHTVNRFQATGSLMPQKGLTSLGLK